MKKLKDLIPESVVEAATDEKVPIEEMEDVILTAENIKPGIQITEHEHPENGWWVVVKEDGSESWTIEKRKGTHTLESKTLAAGSFKTYRIGNE